MIDNSDFSFGKNIHFVDSMDADRNYPICKGVDYVIPGYLNAIETAIKNYVTKWPRVLAIRVDLHFPDGYAPSQKNYIGDFMRRLQSRIDSDLKRKARGGKRVHNCELGYVWVKEVGNSFKPHYHVVLLLNGDTYLGLGEYHPGAPSLFGMISRAWAAALGSEDMFWGKGVFIPQQGTYKINTSHDDFYEELSRLFYRLSYFAKTDTKYYSGQGRNIGYSR